MPRDDINLMLRPRERESWKWACSCLPLHRMLVFHLTTVLQSLLSECSLSFAEPPTPSGISAAKLRKPTQLLSSAKESHVVSGISKRHWGSGLRAQRNSKGETVATTLTSLGGGVGGVGGAPFPSPPHFQTEIGSQGL